MKAKDLTQDDVGKWVNARMQIISILEGRVYARFEGDTNEYLYHEAALASDTILEFTTPPPTLFQKVGDTVRHINNGTEWTIVAIHENACLLRYLTGHISADYPLNPNQWTPTK